MPIFDNINFCSVEDVREMNAIGDLVDAEKVTPPFMQAGFQVSKTLGRNLTQAFKQLIYDAVPVLSITAASPPVVTTTRNHGYSTGDSVCIDKPGGMLNAQGVYRAVVTSPTTFELYTLDTVSVAWDGSQWGSYKARTGSTFPITKIRYDVFLYARYMQAMLVGRDTLALISAAKANNGILLSESGFMKPAKEDRLAMLRNDAIAAANSYGAEIARIICDEGHEFPEVGLNEDYRTNPDGKFVRLRSM